ncbi:VOC family protein [Halobacillus sp. KGW1]|uniref:VOC family protein n=1 Tax=Halobacillus sp. KGW1 TaxID=1793726 RepID=UPI0007836A8A|nr:VOC family protein [Halobacillus sp. KGW1]
MALQAKQTYLNLPVKDLDKSMRFFKELGFDFHTDYTDDKAACLIINERTFLMLLVNDMFDTFTNKERADTAKQTEMIIAVSTDTRKQVDDIVNKALEAGGKPSNEPFDHGFMYGWSFQDLDGHLWEVMYMEENANEEAAG